MSTLLVVNGTRPYDLAALRLIARAGARADAHTASDVVDVVAARDPKVAHARVRASNATRIVVAGGDGAVNLVVDALAGRPVPVVVVPAGSANDLARAVHDSARAVDVLVVNGRRFCTVGGLGIPALVARRANAVRAHPVAHALLRYVGRGLYSALALAEIARRAQPRRVTVRVVVDGEEREIVADVDGLFVCNQPMVAGIVTVCSHAKNDDGRFEIALVHAGGRRQRAATFARMVAGRALSDADVAIVSAARAEILVDEPVGFFGDGEELAFGSRFEVDVRPRELNVRRASRP